MTPFISVCIPAYNAGRFLADTIDSVLAQTFTDFELIILNNGSSDNTDELLSRYSDKRLQVVTSSVTVPAHENWTRVVSLARGSWVKLLCADDLLKPSALQKIHDDLVGDHEALVHVGARDVIDEDGNVVARARARFKDGKILRLADVVNAALRTGTNPLGEPVCVTWRRSLTESVGPFSNQWKYMIDLDYWLRLSSLSSIHHTSEVVGSFRVSRGSWTSSIGFGALREASTFFTRRDEFVSRNLFTRYRAVVKAWIRTFARQVFLSFRAK